MLTCFSNKKYSLASQNVLEEHGVKLSLFRHNHVEITLFSKCNCTDCLNSQAARRLKKEELQQSVTVYIYRQ